MENKNEQSVHLLREDQVFKDYAEQLKSPYWRQYRRVLLEYYGHQCQECGLGDDYPQIPLQVHHKRYIRGLKPWQYTNPEDVTVLCLRCHRRAHNRRFGQEPLPGPLKPGIDIVKEALGKAEWLVGEPKK